MPASRIMIVDDFEEWRSKVCSILQEQQELQVMAEAGVEFKLFRRRQSCNQT